MKKNKCNFSYSRQYFFVFVFFVFGPNGSGNICGAVLSFVEQPSGCFKDHRNILWLSNWGQRSLVQPRTVLSSTTVPHQLKARWQRGFLCLKESAMSIFFTLESYWGMCPCSLFSPVQIQTHAVWGSQLTVEVQQERFSWLPYMQW